MGMARGKVGDVVLTRLAGEQVARARNRAPKNPKTTKQMAQRAALATCVEFYIRGVKNLFKFAFESKKPSESDYNAFVRANIGIIPVQSHKTLVENGPVFGPIIMSQGSLNAPSLTQLEAGTGFMLTGLNLTKAGDQMTVGDLSKVIANAYGCQDGDIFTLVAINTGSMDFSANIEAAKNSGFLAAKDAPESWSIRQFTLDFSSSALASTLAIFNMTGVHVGDTTMELDMDNFFAPGWDDGYMLMAAAIVSRNTASGVKVSTSVLQGSDPIIQTSAIGTSNEWRQYVARTWNTSTSLEVAPENILQGSISANK